ncbi:preprotein translocase subunit SecA [Patescibacteria group bacterium]|nr:MAG: preprotein translocase subunit SecA [Patescibacteria group bacterium]
MSILTKIFGDPNERELKKLWPIVEEVNKIEKSYQKLSNQELRAKTEEFKKRLKKGEKLDDLMPEAFAVIKSACRRLLGKKWEAGGVEITWNMVPFDVQILGAIVLHQGKISEMKTGEGKTLAATMPLYLNALRGKGAHLITVNDYLARRDTEWMGEIYKFLDLEVGVILHDLSPEDRRKAYNADITYGTNNEFGFDYLRGNMVQNLDQKVQRGLHYVIVDEVDSILIDEARTPLIISAPDAESTEKYRELARLTSNLKENIDYNIDHKMRVATLTEKGIAKMEKLLGVDNIYAEGGIETVHHVEQALKAYALFQKDRDYVVKNGEVIIVDEFTGRLMPGRRFSQGLHQAIEAKEGVEVQQESKTLATITFQNYFRMYDKLAGMTGTAVTEAAEFAEIYKLEVIVIPTHKPMIREDLNDRIYKNEVGKFKAATQEIKKRHKFGQPVLVGTISIEKSEILSDLLKREGIKHEVLNAKHHEKEAHIVAKAGELSAVTIATNMAGRGTDIRLAEGVVEKGGLHILGTERHESRRIDNQLRGRSGRQGDPGSSQFYVSMEDDLMKRFGSDRVKGIMDALGVEDDQPIEHKMISHSIENAQKKVETYNFDIRKHLVEYDDVMNKQREIIYKLREEILTGSKNNSEKSHKKILDLIREYIKNLIETHTQKEWDRKEIKESLNAIFPLDERVEKFIDEVKNKNELEEKTIKIAETLYETKAKNLGAEAMRELEKLVYLRTIDTLWIEHLSAMEMLREGIGLRGYGQRDPLVEYKREGFNMFQRLLGMIENNLVTTIYKVEILKQPLPMEGQQEARGSLPASQKGLGGSSESPTEKAAEEYVGKTKTKKQKVGRNDPCPCGSGKKYKKCCGR